MPGGAQAGYTNLWISRCRTHKVRGLGHCSAIVHSHQKGTTSSISHPVFNFSISSGYVVASCLNLQCPDDQWCETPFMCSLATCDIFCVYANLLPCFIACSSSYWSITRFTVYSGYKCAVRYLCCEYFLLVCGLPFSCSLWCFWSADIFNRDEIHVYNVFPLTFPASYVLISLSTQVTKVFF